MSIKKHHEYYDLVLEIVKLNGPTSMAELREIIASKEGLTEEEKRFANARGTNIFGSRIHWSAAVLVLAGLLYRPERAHVAITDLGIRLMAENPEGITDELVKSQQGYKEMEERARQNKERRKALDGDEASDFGVDSDQTPIEQLGKAIQELENSVSAELVQKIQNLEPYALEKLILKLMQAMGYGASEEMLEHVGGPGDEGIDGVISLDQLGFHRIYLQAKRYKTGNNITTDQMNSFIGAIERKGGIGGVFVTTSAFTDGAIKAAKETPKHISLIDGHKLGQNMIRFEVGVRFPSTYREVQMDETFFDELTD